MQVVMDKKFTGKVMNDRSIDQSCLIPEATRTAQRLESGTPRRTGRTAGSTRIEVGHKNAKRDRRAVRVTQSFAAVPMNWRTKRGYMLRAVR